MNSRRRILGIVAIVWAVGVAGVYIGCRSRGHATPEPEGAAARQETALAKNSLTGPDPMGLPGSKSGAVFAPADLQPTTSPATAPASTRRFMPGSKSAPIEFEREPAAPAPKQVLPGSKSFQLVDPPGAAPADNK